MASEPEQETRQHVAIAAEIENVHARECMLHHPENQFAFTLAEHAPASLPIR